MPCGREGIPPHWWWGDLCALRYCIQFCHLRTVLYGLGPRSVTGGQGRGARECCLPSGSTKGPQGPAIVPATPSPFFLLLRLAIPAFHPTQTLLPVVSIQEVMHTEEQWWGRSQGSPKTQKYVHEIAQVILKGYYPFSPELSCSFNFPTHEDKSGVSCLYLWRKCLIFPSQPSFQAQHNKKKNLLCLSWDSCLWKEVCVGTKQSK